jgi:hypothetical protein
MVAIRGLAAALLLAAAACSSEEKQEAKKETAPHAQARGQAVTVSQSFVVEAVDAPNRTITLRSSTGKTGTFKAGDQVKRFNEIHVGDMLVAQYAVSVVAELREPTAEEKAAPMVVQDSSTRAAANAPPGGALTRTTRVVTTVDAVDRSAHTITLKGPQGNTVTAIVEDPTALQGINTGQHVIATFREQLVLAMEPGKKPE